MQFRFSDRVETEITMEENANQPYEQPVELPGGETLPSTPSQPKPKRSKRKLLIIVFGLLIVTGLALAAIKLLNKPKSTSPQQSTQQTVASPNALKPTEVTSDSSTKTFTAETLAIEFKYPTNWTVVEKDGSITVKSPVFNFQTTQGTQAGYYRIYIRKGARDVDSKYIGRGVACLPTEKMTYANPNPDQRKETNLSFFGYDDSNNCAFTMITGNFTLKKGDTLGVNYGKEADTYIIVGGYSTDANKDDLSFQQVPPDKFQSTTAYKQALELLKSLKVS